MLALSIIVLAAAAYVLVLAAVLAFFAGATKSDKRRHKHPATHCEDHPRRAA